MWSMTTPTNTTSTPPTEFTGGHYKLSRGPAGWVVLQVSTRDPARRTTRFRGSKEQCEAWLTEFTEVDPVFGTLYKDKPV